MANNDFKKIEKKLLLLQQMKPNQSWKRDTRALLLTSAAEPRSNSGQGWRFALAGFTVILLLSGFTSLVAANSLPGDLFYPLKRTFEQARLNLAGQDQQLALRTDLTEKRITELRQVVEQNSTQSNQAILEVENSVSAINSKVTQERARLQSLQEVGQSPAAVKQSLAELVPTIEEKQVQLQKIEPTLSTEGQAQVQTIITQLEEIRSSINKALQPDVKGIQDQKLETQTAPETPLLKLP